MVNQHRFHLRLQFRVIHDLVVQVANCAEQTLLDTPVRLVTVCNFLLVLLHVLNTVTQEREQEVRLSFLLFLSFYFWRRDVRAQILQQIDHRVLRHK